MKMNEIIEKTDKQLMRFYKETNIWPPGKSAPRDMDMSALNIRTNAYHYWCKMQSLHSSHANLLKACEETLRFIKDYGSDRHFSQHPDNCSHCILIKKAEQAIASAKGGK